MQPAFDDQNLIGAADGREAVGNDEGRAPLHQLTEPGLDHGFGLGVERTGGLIENENARLGQQSAGDREPLALAAGELDAALADDGVVGIREALGKLVHAGRAAGEEKLLFGGVGARKEDVFADRAVEEKRLLQDHAQLGAEGVQIDLRQIHIIDQRRGRWTACGRRRAS